MRGRRGWRGQAWVKVQEEMEGLGVGGVETWRRLIFRRGCVVMTGWLGTSAQGMEQHDRHPGQRLTRKCMAVAVEGVRQRQSLPLAWTDAGCLGSVRRGSWAEDRELGRDRRPSCLC